jgi:hypothetical protein
MRIAAIRPIETGRQVTEKPDLDAAKFVSIVFYPRPMQGVRRLNKNLR